MLLNQINIMKTNLPQTQNLCSPRYSSNTLSGSSVLPRVKFHPQYLVFVLQLEKNTIIFINVKWYTIFLSALYNNACHSEACPISPNSDISSSFRIAMYVYNLMVFWPCKCDWKVCSYIDSYVSENREASWNKFNFIKTVA